MGLRRLLSRNFFAVLGFGDVLDRGHQFHCEVSGFSLEYGELAFLSAAFEFGRAAVDPGLATRDEPVVEACQGAGHGLNPNFARK